MDEPPTRSTRKKREETKNFKSDSTAQEKENDQTLSVNASPTGTMDSTIDFMKQMLLDMRQKDEDDRKERERIREEERSEQERKREEERREWEQIREEERKERARHEEVIGIKLEQERRELEQQRMEHENRMIEKQQEFEKSRRDKTEKKKIADKIVKMEDTDQPDAYFKRFEYYEGS